MNYFRMYIDETGNPGYKASEDENNRYLSLTGIIVNENYARKILKNNLDNFKKYFFNQNYSKVFLHRKEIINKKPPFDILKVKSIENKFNKKLLRLLKELEYTVMTVVLDKYEIIQKYLAWQAHPYHYCLEIMVERFFYFLRTHDGLGSIAIEARSKTQDKRLKHTYSYYLNQGTSYIKAEQLRKYFATSEIKFFKKKDNIATLQIADIIAHPSCEYLKSLHRKTEIKSIFAKKIISAIKTKYYKNKYSSNCIGYGLKWLP